MSVDYPGLEERAHEMAAWGHGGGIPVETAKASLMKQFPGLTYEQATEACRDHGPMCSHPTKTEEQLRARFYRQRASDRARAIELIKKRFGIDEDAEAIVDYLADQNFYVREDRCDPAHRYHTNPHKGCVLR